MGWTRSTSIAARVRSAVAEIVRKQVDLGIDVVDDGELGKPSFVTYVRDRLGGLEPLECVLVRSDNEAVVVNLDIEPAEKPEVVKWIDPIHRG